MTRAHGVCRNKERRKEAQGECRVPRAPPLAYGPTHSLCTSRGAGHSPGGGAESHVSVPCASA
eukprot:1323987-Rhodomonas_salina.1